MINNYMTKEELAEKLDGIEYSRNYLEPYVEIAKQNGLLIITGYSDDLIEFEGVFREEIPAGEVWINRDGVIEDFDVAKDYWQDESDCFEWAEKKEQII